MSDFTNWKRVYFDSAHAEVGGRLEAEKETNQDLQKPIQQLVCDVGELAKKKGVNPEMMQLLAAARIAAMFGRVALEHERVNKRILSLTRVVAVLTVVVAVLTVILVLLTAALLHHG